MRERFYWGYIILGVSFLLVLASYGIRFGYGILIPPMKSSLMLTDVQSGFIASAYFTSYTLSAPLIGYIVDRFGCRKVIPMLCATMGLGTFMMGSIKDWSLGSFFFALVGFGSHAGWVAVIRLLTVWFDSEKRGRAIGVANSGYGVGYGLMGLLLPVIVGEYGWREGWHLLGSFTIIVAFSSAYLLREDGSTNSRFEARTQPATLKIFSSANFW
ncbi:MAG: MFS transporter, partial [Nitrososphaerales archaeon]